METSTTTNESNTVETTLSFGQAFDLLKSGNAGRIIIKMGDN